MKAKANKSKSDNGLSKIYNQIMLWQLRVVQNLNKNV